GSPSPLNRRRYKARPHRPASLREGSNGHVSSSNISGTKLRHHDVVQPLATDARLQGRRWRGTPVAHLIESGDFTPVVDHEQHAVVPRRAETADRHGPCAACRITQ